MHIHIRTLTSTHTRINYIRNMQKWLGHILINFHITDYEDGTSSYVTGILQNTE